MSSTNTTPKVFPSKGKGKRPYGKAPLELSLPQAIEAVEEIAKQGKSLTESQLALALGNTITSSAFTRKVRALSVYGLLTESTGGEFTLTDLALTIALPRSPQAQIDAKMQAFLKVEQFAFLFNQHKGKLLPADEFLRNILEQECGVPRDVSESWVKHFKDGAVAAGLFHSRGDGKIQIAETPVLAEVSEPPTSTEPPEDSGRSEGDGNTKRPPHERPVDSPSTRSHVAASGHSTRIELSDGRHAEISIPDRLSPRDAQKLQRALDGIKVIIESMVTEVT
jgi:hypothetical protein